MLQVRLLLPTWCWNSLLQAQCSEDEVVPRSFDSSEDCRLSLAEAARLRLHFHVIVYKGTIDLVRFFRTRFSLVFALLIDLYSLESRAKVT